MLYQASIRANMGHINTLTRGYCTMLTHIPVSVGELFDKITILKIKYNLIKDPVKHRHVAEELKHLQQIAQQHVTPSEALEQAIQALGEINQRLWSIEDDIRACERANDFGDTFVRLARKVYRCNDERANTKSTINKLTNSLINEVKSYEAY
jgi:hypothetical protein